MLALSVQITASGGRPVAGKSYNLTCNINISESTNVILSYQWSKNSEPIDSETNKVLVFPFLQLTDGGNYTCEVTVNQSTQTTTNESNVWIIVPQSELILFLAH